MYKPIPVKKNPAVNYAVWLDTLKRQIRGMRLRAALSVNAELIRLYHHIGLEILRHQKTHAWGDKVIKRLAADLKADFPDMRGFSVSNLKYMRYFAEHCPDIQIGQQSADQLPWFHIRGELKPRLRIRGKRMRVAIQRAESPLSTGVRTSLSASRLNNAQRGRGCPRSCRAESPIQGRAKSSRRAARAECPIGNSVGRSPTTRGTPHDKPCRGAIKWMSPLQGLMVLVASYVGLRPTLLTTPFQG